jgi:transcriptional regulator with XRE-family HTH domain
MTIGEKIKEIREKKQLLQKELAAELGLDKSSYSKLEKGLREVKVSELQKLSKLFSLSIDDIVNYEGDLPSEVSLKDETAAEQNRLFNELDEEDRQTVLTIVDKMLTNKKFSNFFQENIAK